MSDKYDNLEVHKEFTNEAGDFHRVDGPALILRNGTERWYLNGVLHREDGPAVSSYTGFDYWYFNGKRHRVDGPAVYNHYTKTGVWYNHGVVHRDGGPAWESPNEKKWYQNGIVHRSDGPAYINSLYPQSNLYYYKGNSMKSEEDWFQSLTEEEKIKYLFNIDTE